MSDKKEWTIEGILPGGDNVVCLRIANGIIKKISKVEKTDSKKRYPNLAPGLIDNQVNGYLGVDFTEPGLSEEKIQKVTKSLWMEGVTTYLPTLITGDPNIVKENLAEIAKAINGQDLKGSIPGVHLEGPYISPEDGFRGAHSRKWVRNPDWNEFLEFYEAADGKVVQITLAPELSGAIEFIKKVSELNIVVALGHHNASAETIQRAVKAGASTVTHLGNGCANMIHRHQNPLWPQLAEDRLMASLIVDGIHLNREEVITFFRVKGIHNTILTSDMAKFAGMKPGEYEWDDKKVTLTPSGEIRYTDQNVLAGSAVVLRKGIGNMVRYTGCSLSEAIQMAAGNPARLYGFYDRGVIKEGARADLIVYEFKNEELQIRKTIIEGNIVYNSTVV